MRKLHVVIAMFVLAGTLCSGTAQATSSTSGGTTTTSSGGTPTGGQCGFDPIKNSLYKTESAGDGGYTAKYLGGKTAWGKYQFIPDTRAGYIAANPQCKTKSGKSPNTCNSNYAFISEDCWPVQECLMDAFMKDNLNAIRKDPACQELLANGGKAITGVKGAKTKSPKSLSCNVTESGLLAAFHLGGRDECRKIKANGQGDSDALGTSTAYYTCAHKDLCVPGGTSSSTNTSGDDMAGPVGTQAQLDFGGDFGLDLTGPEDPLRYWWDAAFMLMAEAFTVNMELQVQAIGQIFDAKHQLETQRLMQEKSAEAHRDYQPSEQMCTFGTFARDLHATDRTATAVKQTVAERILEREVAQGDGIGQTERIDSLSRIAQFRNRFCDKDDNARNLYQLCPKDTPAHMRNRDINFTQTIDQPLSLDIDLNDGKASDDEEAVFALVDNLFAAKPLPRPPEKSMELRKYNYNYLNMRSITAMRGIARNTLANIIAIKTATPNRDEDTNAPNLRALLREFGLKDDEIRKQLGPNPSYYAQMEFLTRKIYQSPTFYYNLYDKPANVQRIRAAMKAIKLMQDRDIQAALQRREVLLSMLLEIRLRERSEDVYNKIEGPIFEPNLSSKPAAK